METHLNVSRESVGRGFGNFPLPIPSCLEGYPRKAAFTLLARERRWSPLSRYNLLPARGRNQSKERTKMAVRELDEDQRKIQEEARTIVKVLGLLKGLSNAALMQIKDACSKRITPKADEDVKF